MYVNTKNPLSKKNTCLVTMLIFIFLTSTSIYADNLSDNNYIYIYNNVAMTNIDLFKDFGFNVEKATSTYDTLNNGKHTEVTAIIENDDMCIYLSNFYEFYTSPNNCSVKTDNNYYMTNIPLVAMSYDLLYASLDSICNIIGADIVYNSAHNTCSITYDNKTNTYTYYPRYDGIIYNSTTMIPIRGVFEEFGYEVTWDNETQTAKLVRDDYIILIPKGKNYFYVNDEKITPDVSQQIIDGSLYLPLRAVGESIGAEIIWNQSTKTAIITVFYPSYISLTAEVVCSRTIDTNADIANTDESVKNQSEDVIKTQVMSKYLSAINALAKIDDLTEYKEQFTEIFTDLSSYVDKNCLTDSTKEYGEALKTALRLYITADAYALLKVKEAELYNSEELYDLALNLRMDLYAEALDIASLTDIDEINNKIAELQAFVNNIDE